LPIFDEHIHAWSGSAFDSMLRRPSYSCCLGSICSRTWQMQRSINPLYNPLLEPKLTALRGLDFATSQRPTRARQSNFIVLRTQTVSPADPQFSPHIVQRYKYVCRSCMKLTSQPSYRPTVVELSSVASSGTYVDSYILTALADFSDLTI